tara:strand:- start:10804 stop:11049 length:246 start_codon:yes stop_codon:yes gene_type:complete
MNNPGNPEVSGAAASAGEQCEHVAAWRVEFENGDVEIWPATSIKGRPSFGRWVTPLVVGGETPLVVGGETIDLQANEKGFK